MANLDIDTTSAQYQNLLNGLSTLRTVMGPRVKLLVTMLKKNEEVKVKQWLDRDPLLRRCIRFAQTLNRIIDREIDE